MELQFVDRVLTCSDCRSDFIFTAGEQLFFEEKQFKNDPKRCKNCKSKRALTTAGAPQPLGAKPAQARTETRTSCSDCGVETTVPFKPTQGRPVLCRLCYQKKLRMPAALPSSLPAVSAIAGSDGTRQATAMPVTGMPPIMIPAAHRGMPGAEDAIAALAALPADVYGEGISPEAALMAAASVSNAVPHSSVATLEDLQSIALLQEPAQNPASSVPIELLAQESEDHLELLEAMETADA